MHDACEVYRESLLNHFPAQPRAIVVSVPHPTVSADELQDVFVVDGSLNKRGDVDNRSSNPGRRGRSVGALCVSRVVEHGVNHPSPSENLAAVPLLELASGWHLDRLGAASDNRAQGAVADRTFGASLPSSQRPSV